MVWVSGDSSIFDCWFHSSFFFFPCLFIEKVLVPSKRNRRRERELERGMRGELIALLSVWT